MRKVLFLLMCFCPLTIFAQVKTVSGKVTDPDDIGMPSVNVIIKGTTTGTTTNLEGTYSISSTSSTDILVFSFIGMSTQEITVGDKQVINVQLQPESALLDEIVVVGYGEEKKMNLTGSVSTVQATKIVKVPSANISEILIGKASGLITKQSSSLPGRDNTTLSIRGYDAPLVLVDGIETSWQRIDPQEIESISVLKDAAAAVYGARAGNGVILITTKRGSLGKPTIDYTSNFSIQQPTKIPNFLPSWKWAELVREGELNSGLAFTYTEEDIQKYREGNDPNYVNTDWYDLVFKKWAPMQSHNLGVRGGNEGVKYFVSAGFLDQGSLFESGDMNFNRYNARSNLDAQITKDLLMSLDLSFREEYTESPLTAVTDMLDIRGPDGLEQVWLDITKAQPVHSGTLPNPGIGGAYSGFSFTSPYATTLSDMSGSKTIRDQFLNGRINLKYSLPFINGLEIQAALNYTLVNTYIKTQDKPFDVFSYNQGTDEYIYWGTNGANTLDEYFQKNSQIYPLLSLNYNNTFGNHEVKGLLLMEGIRSDRLSVSAGRINLLSVDIPYLFAGSQDGTTNNGVASQTGRVSYVGRGNYSYKGKYLLEGTFRYDASYKFPENSRWGFFPSISAGWNLSEENFIKDNVNWISYLKLRASYSKAGNDNVAEFKYLTGYDIMSGAEDIYQFGSTAYRRITSTGIPNPDITWLEMTSYNVGLEAWFLDRLIGFELDLFYRRTENIFGQPTENFPSTFGAILPQMNINSMEDKGFEFNLHHRKRIGNGISYGVSAFVGLARQKWLKYSENPYDDPDEIRIYKQTGNYTNRWIGYVSDGLFMTQEEIDNHPVNQDASGNTTLRPGDIKYMDINGDSLIDWRDQDVIGYGGFPDLTYGVDLQFDYKSIRVSALFQGASMFNMMMYGPSRIPLWGMGTAFDIHYDYRWKPDPENPNININPDAKLPVILGDGSGITENSRKHSDFWLLDGTYLRLKNLNIGYSLPKRWIQGIGMQDLSVFVAGSNLFTLSKLGIYKNFQDPESSEIKYYPPLRTITFGINVKI